MTPLNERPHVLYRMFDAAGELLYVGLTVTPADRLREHATTKTWWDEVNNITLERYADRGTVEDAERIAIKTENPRFNVVNAGPGARRRWAARTAGHLPDLNDPVLRKVRDAVEDWERASARRIAAIQAAFDAGVSREQIAEAAGLTRYGVYKLLGRASAAS